MPRQQLMYIELNEGYAYDGPAWIGKVTFSKSGRTLYFNGKALKRIPRGGISGNYADLETGEEYWVSGVKKDGSDRHWAGGGVIAIDTKCVDEYLHYIGKRHLDPARFEVCTDIVDTDIGRFHQIENTAHNEENLKE